MNKNWADLHHFLHFVAARFKEDRCPQIAASLTFTTLLSLVPLFTIALTLLSAFPVFDNFAEQIKSFMLANMMPETGGKIISRYVEQFAESAERLTAFGIVFLALTAMLMIHTIEVAFNIIWRISESRTFIQRILIYWAMLTLAPLLIGGSLSATSWLAGISVGYAKEIPEIDIVMLKVIPVLLTTLAFSLLFRIVPNRFVPLRHAIIGGIVAAIAFETMNRIFAYYITHFTTYKLVYGAFASIPIFLLWIYLSWLTILFGALITASLPYWRGRPTPKLTAAAEFYYALRLLKIMSEAMQSGKVQTVPMLSQKLHVSFDVLENILSALARINIVDKLAGRGWAMIRNTESIQVSELYRLFVFNPAKLIKHPGDEAIHARLVKMDQQIGNASSMTLRELFAQPDSL
jgi:membrane protein